LPEAAISFSAAERSAGAASSRQSSPASNATSLSKGHAENFHSKWIHYVDDMLHAQPKVQPKLMLLPVAAAAFDLVGL
jgi:hypothetical protein